MWKPKYSLWQVPINFSLAFLSNDPVVFVGNATVGLFNLLYFLTMDPDEV